MGMLLIILSPYRSVKGTVRGMRNLVKTGIATFLMDQNIKVNLVNLSIYIFIFIYNILYTIIIILYYIYIIFFPPHSPPIYVCIYE